MRYVFSERSIDRFLRSGFRFCLRCVAVYEQALLGKKATCFIAERNSAVLQFCSQEMLRGARGENTALTVSYFLCGGEQGASNLPPTPHHIVKTRAIRACLFHLKCFNAICAVVSAMRRSVSLFSASTMMTCLLRPSAAPQSGGRERGEQGFHRHWP